MLPSKPIPTSKREQQKEQQQSIRTREKRQPPAADTQHHSSKKRHHTSTSTTTKPPPPKRPHHPTQTTPEQTTPYGRCSNVSTRYIKLNRIGEGTYGIVYRARDKTTNEMVALKKCIPHHESSDGFFLTTLREIRMLRELSAFDHPGIVRLMDVAVSSSRSGVFLVFEYCEHDLANLVDAYYNTHTKSPFRESEVKQLVKQLLSALRFLHSRFMLHRDIKLSNLLYTHKGQLKLADFGLARKASRKRPNEEEEGWWCTLTPKVVSLWYRPPEVLFGSEEYGEGVDNWGVGCVMAELLKGVPLMKGRNEMDQIQKMFDVLGPPTTANWPGLNEMPLVRNESIQIPPPNRIVTSTESLLDKFDTLSSAGLSLLSNLLKYDPDRRITAKDALQSDYFGEVPLPAHLSRMPTFPTKEGRGMGRRTGK